MEFLMPYVFGIGALWVAVIAVTVGGRKKRIRNAYTWKKPNVHGQRKFATDEQLKKAGLL